MAFSPAGTNWTIKSTGVTNSLKDIATLNGYYMAIGNNGMVLLSTFRMSQPPRILPDSLVRLGNGAFQFTVQSEPNLLPTIDASTDLLTWVTLAPPTSHTTPDDTGLVTFTDTDATNHAGRFYRARLTDAGF